MQPIIYQTGIFYHWGSVWRALTFLTLFMLLVCLGIIMLALAVREWRKIMLRYAIWQQNTIEIAAVHGELAKARAMKATMTQATAEGLAQMPPGLEKPKPAKGTAPEDAPSGGTSAERPAPPAHDD